MVDLPIKIVIFHSYVSLPEGIFEGALTVLIMGIGYRMVRYGSWISNGNHRLSQRLIFLFCLPTKMEPSRYSPWCRSWLVGGLKYRDRDRQWRAYFSFAGSIISWDRARGGQCLGKSSHVRELWESWSFAVHSGQTGQGWGWGRVTFFENQLFELQFQFFWWETWWLQ